CDLWVMSPASYRTAPPRVASTTVAYGWLRDQNALRTLAGDRSADARSLAGTPLGPSEVTHIPTRNVRPGNSGCYRDRALVTTRRRRVVRKRESGGNPELPRSGEWKRPRSSALGLAPGKRPSVGDPGPGSTSTSPKTCPRGHTAGVVAVDSEGAVDKIWVFVAHACLHTVTSETGGRFRLDEFAWAAAAPGGGVDCRSRRGVGDRLPSRFDARRGAYPVAGRSRVPVGRTHRRCGGGGGYRRVPDRCGFAVAAGRAGRHRRC